MSCSRPHLGCVGASSLFWQSCIRSCSLSQALQRLQSGSTSLTTSTGERVSYLGSVWCLNGCALPPPKTKAVRSVGELDQAFSLPFILQSLRTISREFLGFVEGVFTSTLAVAQFQLARYMSSVGCVSQELNKNLRKICGSL